MNQQTNAFKRLFGLNAAIHILGILLQNETILFITKPLLMVFLALYFYAATPKDKVTKWTMWAIIFSFGGDVALMFQNEAPIYFILGLASFLIAHICYTYGMAQLPNFKKGILFRKAWLGIPLLAYGVFLVYFLWSGLGEMTLPVVIYSMVIMLMGLSAIHTVGRISPTSSTLLVIGALLFIASDSVIALNKFASATLAIPHPSLIIMTTYILGQYLIIEGIIKRKLV